MRVEMDSFLSTAGNNFAKLQRGTGQLPVDQKQTAQLGHCILSGCRGTS